MEHYISIFITAVFIEPAFDQFDRSNQPTAGILQQQPAIT